MGFVMKTPNEKDEYTKMIIENVKNDSDDKFTDAFYTLSSYIIDTNDTEEETEEFRQKILYDYIDFILKDMTRDNYMKILKRSFDTYDIYGLGMAISKLTFSMKHLIDPEPYAKLCDFSYQLVHPNVMKRLTVEEAISKYNDILKLYF
jgi:hypothetical protein